MVLLSENIKIPTISRVKFLLFFTFLFVTTQELIIQKVQVKHDSYPKSSASLQRKKNPTQWQNTHSMNTRSQWQRKSEQLKYVISQFNQRHPIPSICCVLNTIQELCKFLIFSNLKCDSSDLSKNCNQFPLSTQYEAWRPETGLSPSGLEQMPNPKLYPYCHPYRVVEGRVFMWTTFVSSQYEQLNFVLVLEALEWLYCKKLTYLLTFLFHFLVCQGLFLYHIFFCLFNCLQKVTEILVIYHPL